MACRSPVSIYCHEQNSSKPLWSFISRTIAAEYFLNFIDNIKYTTLLVVIRLSICEESNNDLRADGTFVLYNAIMPVTGDNHVGIYRQV
jgi:hypothetical protein